MADETVMNWAVFELDATMHVMPLNDSASHLFDIDCECGPKTEMLANGNMLIVHDAFDGRLAVEEAYKILTDKRKQDGYIK